MNDNLQNYAREELKKGLSQCTKAEQRMFKLGYAPFKEGEPVEERLEKYPINKVVDLMSVEKLDHAMQLVQRTLDKKEQPWNSKT